MREPTKILLVDDHAVLRAGLKSLLEAEDDLVVVGEAASGDEAVTAVQKLSPDVVVMDLSMPGSSGLEATRRIVAMEMGPRVLVLTMHSEEEHLVPVLEAGASGYLSKTGADDQLINALRVVARGEVYLPPSATTRLLREYKESAQGDGTDRLGGLSLREQEVLALTAEGFSSREIGEKLFISPKTVDTYRARIMEKLGFTHRTELVRFALRVGLLKDL